MKKNIGLGAVLVILVLVLIGAVCVIGVMQLWALQSARRNAVIQKAEEYRVGDLTFQADQNSGSVSPGVPRWGELKAKTVSPMTSQSSFRYATISLFAGGLIFLVVFGIVVLLVLRRIFSNPEKRKQREICYDELQQLSQSIAKLDSRLSSLEEIIAS